MEVQVYARPATRHSHKDTKVTAAEGAVAVLGGARAEPRRSSLQGWAASTVEVQGWGRGQGDLSFTHCHFLACVLAEH